jgi:hypothetical protein
MVCRAIAVLPFGAGVGDGDEETLPPPHPIKRQAAKRHALKKHALKRAALKAERHGNGRVRRPAPECFILNFPARFKAI